jgi:hypothetical protein
MKSRRRMRSSENMPIQGLRTTTGEAERLRCLEIDDQLEFGWLLDGRSPGLAPFRILSTYVAARRQLSSTLGP